MTGDVVNLRRFRKAKARAEKEAEAAASRQRFGRTKAERLKDEDARERMERAVDAHRREPTGKPPRGEDESQ